MAISQDVCGHSGHKINSLRTDDKMIQIPSGTIVPSGYVTVGKYLLLCTACGLSLETILANDNGKKSRNRTPKPKANQES